MPRAARRPAPAVDAPLPGIKCRNAYCNAVIRADQDATDNFDSIVRNYARHLSRAHNVLNRDAAVERAEEVVVPIVQGILANRQAAADRRAERERLAAAQASDQSLLIESLRDFAGEHGLTGISWGDEDGNVTHRIDLTPGSDRLLINVLRDYSDEADAAPNA